MSFQNGATARAIEPNDELEIVKGTWQMIDLPQIRDARGNLSVVEGNRHIPVDIQRVYYLYDVPADSTRAGHAHKELKQLMMCVAGSFKIHLDNGTTKETITLDRPYKGLVLGPMVWREIDSFSSGSVCLVLASLPFSEADYYREYEDFKNSL
jgi:hypothetical protein